MKTSRISAAAAAVSLSVSLLAGQAWATTQDINFVGVLKAQRYYQPNANLVMLADDDDDDDIVFETVVFGASADALVSGTVQVPSGGPLLPMAVQEGGSQWGREDSRNSLLELNNDRPDGTYNVSLTTKNNGLQSIALNLSGGSYPPVPKITNLSNLQSITLTTDTTIQWNSMGGDANDFIQLSVRDEESDNPVFQSPDPGQPNALNGLSTSTVIPFNSMEPGRLYRIELLFVNTVDYQPAYCSAIAGYSRSVQAEIATTAPSGQSLHAQFDESIPQHNAMNVARNSLVSFRFTRAMNPGFSAINWSGTGLTPANFTYAWLDGNRVLLCKYNSDLPADTNINWMLDLGNFKDANNVPLSGSQSGSFHTSGDTPAPDSPSSPPDAKGCFLNKVRGYLQTGASPVASGMYGCDSDVQMPAFNRVKEPLILSIAANATNATLEAEEWDAEFSLESTYASQADLDAFFPNGDFSFALNTVAHGSKTVTLSLGTTDDYPAAPTVTNLTALQTINPAVPVTISWTALAGWNQTPTVGSTFIEVEIDNDQGNEIFWISPGEGNTNNDGCVIPVGTLFPGRTYRVALAFVKVKDLDTTYGYSGAGFRTVTEFTITTTGVPAMPGVAIHRTGSGMSLDLTANEPYRNFVIETSRDLLRWMPQQMLWMGDTQNTNQWYDNDAQYLPKRYYRLRDLTATENQSRWIENHIDIQGVVWTDGSHTTPLAGATVGTTLDGQTVVTGPDGRFFLETDTAVGNNPLSQTYSVKITSGTQTNTYGTVTGSHPRNQYYEWSTGGYGVSPP